MLVILLSSNFKMSNKIEDKRSEMNFEEYENAFQYKLT